MAEQLADDRICYRRSSLFSHDTVPVDIVTGCVEFARQRLPPCTAIVERLIDDAAPVGRNFEVTNFQGAHLSAG